MTTYHESMNCYVSVSVARTIKVNINEIFMGNDGFLQMFILWIECSQRKKDLVLHKLSIFQGRTYSCYSGKPLTYLKQGWYCKVWQSIILWYMDLLTLSYYLQYVQRFVTKLLSKWIMWNSQMSLSLGNVSTILSKRLETNFTWNDVRN